MVKLFTIGFAGKSAEQFFSTLNRNRIKLLIDVRLSNESQLAGYTKKKDLVFFLEKISNAQYLHAVQFAPTKEILDAYKKKEIDWIAYESRYKRLLSERNAQKELANIDFDHACLLCSESDASRCHRRLLAELVMNNDSSVKIVHL